MSKELLVGDKILIDGESYYIVDSEDSDTGVYKARNISNNIIQISQENMGRSIHIDEEYNMIVQNMQEVMTQQIMSKNHNYCYRVGILDSRL